GTTTGYRAAARLSLATGRFLTDLDVTDRKRVAVLGPSVPRAVFPLGEPRGERVRVGGDWYQVVGVLESRSSPRSRPGPIRTRAGNRGAFVPLPALDRGKDPRPEGIDEIVLRVEHPDQVTPAAEVLQSLLRGTTGRGQQD